MVDSRKPIALETQGVTWTIPRIASAFVAVTVASAIAGMAYAQLATVKYVNAKHAEVSAQIAALADAQSTTSDHIAEMAGQKEDSDRRMRLLVRLVSAQYIEQVNEAGETHRPRSTRARRAADLLQVDPDDPLAGLEIVDPPLR